MFFQIYKFFKILFSLVEKNVFQKDTRKKFIRKSIIYHLSELYKEFHEFSILLNFIK